MRRIALSLLSVVAVSAAWTLAPTVPARADGAVPSYTYVDLGPSILPTGVNTTGLIVGTSQGSDGYLPEMWFAGKMTRLPLPAAPAGHSYAGGAGVLINSAGLVVTTLIRHTTADGGGHPEGVPVAWQIGSDDTPSAPRVLEEPAGDDPSDSLGAVALNNAGNVLIGSANAGTGTHVTAADAGPVTTISSTLRPYTISATSLTAGMSSAPYYQSISIGNVSKRTAMSVKPLAASNAGWMVVENTTPTSSTVQLVDPSGAVTTPPQGDWTFVDDEGDLAGGDYLVPHGSTTAIPLDSVLPADDGFRPGFNQIDGIDSAFDLVGAGQPNDAPQHGFLLRSARSVTEPVVNSTGDAGVTQDGKLGCDTGATVTVNGTKKPECTLRAAIAAENAGTVTAKSITFALPSGSGAIALNSALPALTADGVTIDGSAGPGGSVAVDGTSLPAGSTGLRISGGNDVVQDVSPQTFATGILIDAAKGHDVVRACSIGVSPGSTSATSLTLGIKVVNSPSVTIGGGSASDGNVIGDVAVAALVQGAGSSGATVQSNLIGTDASGDEIPVQAGVEVLDASGARIGGAASSPGAAPGNVFDGQSATSGSALSEDGSGAVGVIGVSALVSGTTVAGNLIGLKPGGTAAPSGHFKFGVAVGGRTSGTVVGGTAAGAGNVIAGVSADDVLVTGTSTSGTQVLGNLLGTDASGLKVIGGSAGGVEVDGASTTTIGSPGPGRNVIAGGGRGLGVGTLATSSPLAPGTVAGSSGGTAAPGTNNVKVTSAMSTVIAGNIIGPGSDGTTVDPSEVLTTGVALAGIGETLGPDNQIAWAKTGVNVANNSETVTGNLIGTTPSGSNGLPNGTGVFVAAGQGVGSLLVNHVPTVRIGVAGQRPNVISGNTVNVYLPSPALVQGNLVGTTSDGKTAIGAYTGSVAVPAEITYGPGVVGAQLFSTGEGAVIGGTQPGMGNVISGGAAAHTSASGDVPATGGLGISGQHTTVQGNDIGVGNDGTTAVPNAGYGIDVGGGGDDTIGAPAPGGVGAKTAAGGNVVAHNGAGGIIVGKHVAGVLLLGNSVHDNTPDGVRLTDDTSNNGIHAPYLRMAVQSSTNTGAATDTTIVTGETAYRAATVQVFTAANCPSDDSEGQSSAVLATGTTDEHGNFTIAVPVQPVGTELDATTTFTTNSSGFSSCVPVSPAAAGSLGKPTAKPGDPDTVKGSDFTPGEPVDATVHSTPVHIATQTADASGDVAFTFTVPAGLDVGRHYLVLTGATSKHAVAIPFTYYTVAGAPRALTARAGTKSVTLTWAAPTTNGGAAVTGYRVQRSTDNRSFATVRTTAGRSVTDTGLVGGRRYYYRVQALNAAGASPASATAGALPYSAPSAPRSLRVRAHHAALALSWAAPAHTDGAAVTSYIVQYASCTIGAKHCVVHSRTVRGRSVTLTHLSHKHRYHLRVIAVNRAGRSPATRQSTARPGK